MNDLRSAERPGLTTPAAMVALEAHYRRDLIDDLATEEPLEIRLAAQGATQSLAVTMRTPGNDFELAAGFLFSEGVVSQRYDIAGISYCVDPAVGEEQHYNIVTVELAGAMPVLERLERHFTVNSSCGVCGKSSIEALQVRAQPIADQFQISYDFIAELPDKMRSAQRIFASTGLQKSITAGIPIVCAVSAPSSLAVETARAFNVTLCGFVRGTRCNVYTTPDRIIA